MTSTSSAGDARDDEDGVVAVMTDDDPSSSSPPRPTIRPIPIESIGRIVAGQAITDLCSAVKELLDNSIDAGAKRICGQFIDVYLFACPFFF